MLNFLSAHRVEIATLTLEHVWLVAISMAIAVMVGVPAGILITRKPPLRQLVIGGANVIETIPSLALFGFLLAAPVLGERSSRIAITALALYALLPIVRNTYVGIAGVDPAVREAARGMGLTGWQMLVQVELPLSVSVILAGVRTATVLSIGIATIAAAIGAGGLGELIFRGLAMVNDSLILAGAIPAAVLALAADFGLGWLEARLRPPHA